MARPCRSKKCVHGGLTSRPCGKSCIKPQAEAGAWQHQKKEDYFIVNGEKLHPRTVYSRGWKQSVTWLRENIDPNAQGWKGKPKFKYIFCFDKKLRKEWQAKALPYPKKDGDVTCAE